MGGHKMEFQMEKLTEQEREKLKEMCGELNS